MTSHDDTFGVVQPSQTQEPPISTSLSADLFLTTHSPTAVEQSGNLDRAYIASKLRRPWLTQSNDAVTYVVPLSPQHCL